MYNEKNVDILSSGGAIMGGSGGASGLSKRDRFLSKIQNERARSAVNQIYRPGASVGDGGTADMLRHEIENNILNEKGVYKHLQKTNDEKTNIERVLQEENLTEQEKEILEAY
jgi:hypothetical protein